MISCGITSVGPATTTGGDSFERVAAYGEINRIDVMTTSAVLDVEEVSVIKARERISGVPLAVDPFYGAVCVAGDTISSAEVTSPLAQPGPADLMLTGDPGSELCYEERFADAAASAERVLRRLRLALLQEYRSEPGERACEVEARFGRDLPLASNRLPKAPLRRLQHPGGSLRHAARGERSGDVRVILAQ